MFKTPTLATGALAGALLLGASVPALAAWTVEPSGSVQVRFDDNVQAQNGEEDDGIISTVGLQARLRQVTEVSEMSVLGGLDLSKYSSVDNLDTDTRETGFIEARAQTRLERIAFSVNGSLRRQDLLRFTRVIDGADQADAGGDSGEDDEFLLDDELPIEDDLLTDADVDLGSTEQLVERDTIRFFPSVSYTVDELTSVGLSFGYYERSYDDDSSSTNFQDSESVSGAFQVRRALSPLSSLSVRAEYAEFDPEDNLESDNYNLTVSWSRALSRLSTLTLSAGGRRTETDVFDDNGGIFSARFNRRTQTGSFYVLLEHRLASSGFGNQVETDRITFGLRQRITQRLSWRLRARAYTTDQISGGGGSNDRDYFQIAPSLQWAIAQDWRLRFSYRYTWIDRETDSDTVSRNSAGIALEYIPQRRL